MRVGRYALLSLALLGLLLLPASSAAEERGEGRIDVEKIDAHRKARRSNYPLGKRISRYLSAAAEETDGGNIAEAQALLDKLRPRRLNPLERAYLYRLKAFVSYSEGDYEAAIENFEKTLKEEILPVRDDSRIRFNIAQLYASLQRWSDVVAALNRWFRYVDEPIPLAYYLMGIAYYQQSEVDAAIENTTKAIDLSPEPAESWLQLLAALYTQKEDYASAVPIFEELVIRHPKKAYWVQLSLLYGALEDYRHSLSVQQLAYLQGFLTEDKELRRLARSYLYHGVPVAAAEVLQKGLADGTIEPDVAAYELLANSWIGAREYEQSLPALEKAAELAENGDLYLRLGQVHMQRENWKQAAEHLDRALAKGDLDNPGNAQLLLGISYYNDQRVSKARASFARARRHEATRTEAERWMQHIAREDQAS